MVASLLTTLSLGLQLVVHSFHWSGAPTTPHFIRKNYRESQSLVTSHQRQQSKKGSSSTLDWNNWNRSVCDQNSSPLPQPLRSLISHCLYLSLLRRCVKTLQKSATLPRVLQPTVLQGGAGDTPPSLFLRYFSSRNLISVPPLVRFVFGSVTGRSLKVEQEAAAQHQSVILSVILLFCASSSFFKHSRGLFSFNSLYVCV